jgi:hypothetical protein
VNSDWLDLHARDAISLGMLLVAQPVNASAKAATAIADNRAVPTICPRYCGPVDMLEVRIDGVDCITEEFNTFTLAAGLGGAGLV